MFQIDHVVFGVNSSPFEAQFGAEEDARRLQSDLPVAGDSVDCVPDVKTGMELNSQLSQLWDFAEINVKKWLSSEPKRICNYFVICLPTKQLGVPMNLFKHVCVFQIAGMFVFPPLESRGKDSNGSSDSARALEIACAKELLSGRETG